MNLPEIHIEDMTRAQLLNELARMRKHIAELEKELAGVEKSPETPDKDRLYFELFDQVPLSLWVEDLSGTKEQIERLQQAGITDFDAYFEENPEELNDPAAAPKIITVNHATLKLYGARDIDELRQNINRIIPSESNETKKAWRIGHVRGLTLQDGESINYTLDGRRIHVYIRLAIVRGYEKSFKRVLLSIYDISKRVEAEQALRESENRFRRLFADSPVSLWVQDASRLKSHLDELNDNGIHDFMRYFNETPGELQQCLEMMNVIDLNKATLNLYRANSVQEFQDRFTHLFPEEFFKSGLPSILYQLAEGKTHIEVNTVNNTCEGDELNVHMSISFAPGHEKTWKQVFISILDVSDQVRAERYLRHIATHDTLTGLPNRALFMDYMEHTLARARRQKDQCAIMFIDLDGFKAVNDHLGHDKGDILLKIVARRLKDCLRGEDVLARMSGDEFTVILQKIDTSKQASEAAQRVAAAIQQPYDLDGATATITASIGISIYPHDGEESQTLVRNADAAMYAAKNNGKNQFTFYDPQMSIKQNLKD